MQILEGIRLIEVADWGFVPSAGTVLGDWGADVIKVEHPVRGDPMRGLVNSGLVPGARGVNFFVEHLSRNKRSIGVDLNRPEGRAVLDKLVSTADIFLTNFLPDARERMRITYEDLRKVNPRLIYAKGHVRAARPRRGPRRIRRLLVLARGGVAIDSRRPANRPCNSAPPSAISPAACSWPAASPVPSSTASAPAKASRLTYRCSATPPGSWRRISSRQ
jgi:crotonobetainyl-CoA:carnitine CoA-transferase CaiB-like acyl-CoA transferase